MSRTFPHLTQPGQIGTLPLRNRMVVSAMGLNLAEQDGSCGERISAFYERMALGGAGLVVMGVTGVAWPAGGNLPLQVAISDDRFIPGLAQLAHRVQRHGARIAAQLHHAGLVATEDMRAGRPLWVPSYPAGGMPDLLDSMLPQELAAFAPPDLPPIELRVMTQADIATVVSQFADAAGRALQAGLDGVEIHAGHGYLLSAFLSPASNRRDDGYGGSLVNRARLLLEVIAAIRARVGRDYPVWVKLDSEEFGRTEGITLADACRTAQLVEAAGADAIAASAYHDVNRGVLHSESNIPHAPERLVSNAAAIRAAVGLQVITAGRIEPAAAEGHLREGSYDFLAMGRKLLADPDLPNKVSAARAVDIRPCVYCYCCVSRIYERLPIRCAVNPETGQERERALLATDRSRHFAVVGGGPGGMEAARRLALRGHRVTLLEAGPRLGGTLAFAAVAYSPNEDLLRWLERAVRRAGVQIQLNRPASAEMLQLMGAEEVIVATGARRAMPAIEGADQPFVFSGDEMRDLVLGGDSLSLEGKLGGGDRFMLRAAAAFGISSRPQLLRWASHLYMPLGFRVTVIGGGLVGLELAELLAQRGRRVRVIERSPHAGSGLYLVRRMRLLAELHELGVEVVRSAGRITIGDREVSYDNANGQRRSAACDHVVVAEGAIGDDSLAVALRAAGFRVHTVGDCRGVSYIEGAMHDAAAVVAEIG